MKYLKPASLLALLFVAVTATVIAWRQYQELLALRVAAAESSGATARIRELERANEQLRGERLVADARTSAETERPAGERPARGDFAARGGREGFRGPDAAARERLNSPEAQALRAIQQKAQLDQRYAALFRSLKLSPEKLDQLKTLLAERQSTAMDVFAAAREQELDLRSNPDQLRQLTATAQASVDQSLKSLLGDAAYAELQTYDQTAAQRNTVSQLERRLSYSDAPLTSQQSSQLVQILASTSPATATTEVTPPMGGRGGPGGPGGGGGEGPAATITTETMTQAASVLTNAQLSALQQLQQQQQAQQQLQQLVGAGGNRGRGPTGG